MGISRGGLVGPIIGKSGEGVGYYRYGKYIVRSLPTKSLKNKIGTELQKASRSTFTKMQQFLSPILPFVRVGFNLAGRLKQMTGHNAAKSYNMLHAFTPENEIDYSKILISFGKLPGAINAIVEKVDDALHFSWSDNFKDKGALQSDQVILLAYDVENGQHSGTISGARRQEGKETIDLSDNTKGDVLHIYIAFVSNDRQSVSMSTYLGEIVY